MDNYQINKKYMNELLEYANQEIITIQIEYPEISGPMETGPMKAINQYYEQAAHKLMRYGKEALYPMLVDDYKEARQHNFPYRKGDLYLTYEVHQPNDCILSFVFDQYEYLGGAHGTTDRFTQTWNMETGERITLKQLFRDPKFYEEEAIGLVKQQMMEEIRQGQRNYYDTCVIDAQHMFKADHYFLTDKDLVIYFQQYEVGPYVSGIPEFKFPYSHFIRLPVCKISQRQAQTETQTETQT